MDRHARARGVRRRQRHRHSRWSTWWRIAEELGRELNPGPFVPTNVVAAAIARFGSAGAAGHLPARVGPRGCDRGLVPQRRRVARAGRRRRAGDRREDGGWRLDGVSRYVQGAGQAALLLVVAKRPDGLVNLLVPRHTPGLSERTLSGLDLTRRFSELTFDGVLVPEGNELRDDRPLPRSHKGWSVMTACLQVATILQAAESVGAAEVLFEETVEYLKKREQFGRTIASFQAIKHRLADLQIELEAMRVAAEYAALGLRRRVRGRGSGGRDGGRLRR